MCSLDVSLPPKWKTYIVPSENIIPYSFLLKQKREFQHFINGFGCQVSNMSSCSVIDKMCLRACEKDMRIYIFDGSGYSKSLQLKMLVPEEHLLKKISLLLHLTTKNNSAAKLENLCMFIKCKEGHIWETFYNFFEFLLKKSSLNLIGTQFYVPLVCKHLILNELEVLYLFSNRLISANNKHTLVKSSCSKPSSPYAAKGHNPIKSPVSQIDLKVLLGDESKQNPLNMSLKRKSTNTENDIKAKTMKVSHQFCKKLKCKCHERNKWKVFKRITQCSIVNYTDLIKTDDAFTDTEYSQICSTPTQMCPISSSMQVHKNNELQFSSNEKLLSKVRVSKNVELSVNSHQVTDITNGKDNFETEKLQDKKGIEQSGEQYDIEKLSNITSDNIIPCLENDDCNSQSFLNHNKKNSQQIVEKEQKTPNYNVAKECLSIPVLAMPTAISTEHDSKQLCVPHMGFQSMSTKQHVNTDKLSKGFQSISCSKLNVSPKSFQKASTSDSNGKNQQPMGFQTAAGKSLNISEKAILAAQKMFEEVCSQEINLLDNDGGETSLPNKPAFKKPAYPDENYQMDNDFNSDFADKFFEEIPFDDKEDELKPKINLMQSPMPSLNSGKSQVGKVRKSLGGRRSLKPYAMKK